MILLLYLFVSDATGDDPGDKTRIHRIHGTLKSTSMIIRFGQHSLVIWIAIQQCFVQRQKQYSVLYYHARRMRGCYTHWESRPGRRFFQLSSFGNSYMIARCACIMEHSMYRIAPWHLNFSSYIICLCTRSSARRNSVGGTRSAVLLEGPSSARDFKARQTYFSKLTKQQFLFEVTSACLQLARFPIIHNKLRDYERDKSAKILLYYFLARSEGLVVGCRLSERQHRKYILLSHLDSSTPNTLPKSLRKREDNV